MNKPLNQYVSKKEICCELEHVFHYRLAKMIRENTYSNFNVMYDTNDETPGFSSLIKLCKWNYITYLQNNGIQNTRIEMYILNLNFDKNKLITSYQLKNGLTTYVM